MAAVVGVRPPQSGISCKAAGAGLEPGLPAHPCPGVPSKGLVSACSITTVTPGAVTPRPQGEDTGAQGHTQAWELHQAPGVQTRLPNLPQRPLPRAGRATYPFQRSREVGTWVSVRT